MIYVDAPTKVLFDVRIPGEDVKEEALVRTTQLKGAQGTREKGLPSGIFPGVVRVSSLCGWSAEPPDTSRTRVCVRTAHT